MSIPLAAGPSAPEGLVRRWFKRWLATHAGACVVPRATIDRCFAEALRIWQVDVSLSPPLPMGSGGSERWGGTEPLAYIDLTVDQVVVNFSLLGKIGAIDSLTAVLAHEIGHHARFPSSPQLVAELMMLEQTLIPGLQTSLTNLFFDLLVNEVVGRTQSGQLVAVYRGFTRQERSEQAPLFGFYLAIYEELWGRPPGTLVTDVVSSRLDGQRPGWREEARRFVSTFFGMTDMVLQFIYFLVTAVRFIPDPAALSIALPLAGDVPMPHVDDFRLAAGTTIATQKALVAARAHGWVIEAIGSESRDAGVLQLCADDAVCARGALPPGEARVSGKAPEFRS